MQTLKRTALVLGSFFVFSMLHAGAFLYVEFTAPAGATISETFWAVWATHAWTLAAPVMLFTCFVIAVAAYLWGHFTSQASSVYEEYR